MNELNKLIKNVKPGDYIPAEEIEKVAGVGRGNPAYGTFINKFKDSLEQELGRRVEQRAYGLYIHTPKSELLYGSKLTNRHMTSARNSSKKMDRMVDLKSLSQEEKDFYFKSKRYRESILQPYEDSLGELLKLKKEVKHLE